MSRPCVAISTIPPARATAATTRLARRARASPDECQPGRRRGDEQTQDHRQPAREVLDRDDDREHDGGRGEHDRRDGRRACGGS